SSWACSCLELVTCAGEPVQLVLIVLPARLILRPLLVVALRRRGVVAGIAVILLLLLIGLGVVDAAAARRRRIKLRVGRAVGRIDVAVIGALQRHLALLRRDHDGFAGGAVLLLVDLWRRRLARDGGVAARTRIARQRDLRRSGQRHRGVEHAFL